MIVFVIYTFHIEVISEFIDIKQYESIKPSKVNLDLVQTAINKLGNESKLKEIYDYLNEKIDYDDIRHAMLFVQFNSTKKGIVQQ